MTELRIVSNNEKHGPDINDLSANEGGGAAKAVAC